MWAFGPILWSVCACLLAAMQPTGPVRSIVVQPSKPHPLCGQDHSLQDGHWADVQRLLPPAHGYGADNTNHQSMCLKLTGTLL